MNPVNLSEHARIRCAQRGIDAGVIQLIMERGRTDFDNHGGCRYFLGKSEKQRLKIEEPGLLKQIGRKIDTVVVTASKGAPIVITTYVRKRKS